MEKLTERDFKKIGICLALYITALLAANTIGIKTMPFFFGMHMSVSVFYFPLVFLMTDLIGEVYGKAMAKRFVWAGFVAVLAFTVFNIVSVLMPWSDKSMWAHDAYNMLFGISIRISIASLLAFIIGEYQDVVLFFFLKKYEGTKSFWLRSNISNIWSQFLDTVVFMLVAFAGVYEWKALVLMIIPWWLFKVGMGALYTPLSYVGIRLLRDNNPSPSA